MAILTHIPVFGEHSSDVALVQTALKESGFDTLGIDGIYGKNTKAAIIKFQEANGLTKDGILGKITLSSFNFIIIIPTNAYG